MQPIREAVTEKMTHWLTLPLRSKASSLHSETWTTHFQNMTSTPSRSSERLRSRTTPAMGQNPRRTSLPSERSTAQRAHLPPTLQRTTATSRSTNNKNIPSDDSSLEHIERARGIDEHNNNTENTDHTDGETTTENDHNQPHLGRFQIENNYEDSDDDSNTEQHLPPPVIDAQMILNLQQTIHDLRQQLDRTSERWATSMDRIVLLQQENHRLQTSLMEATSRSSSTSAPTSTAR